MSTKNIDPIGEADDNQSTEGGWVGEKYPRFVQQLDRERSELQHLGRADLYAELQMAQDELEAAQRQERDAKSPDGWKASFRLVEQRKLRLQMIKDVVSQRRKHTKTSGKAEVEIEIVDDVEREALIKTLTDPVLKREYILDELKPGRTYEEANEELGRLVDKLEIPRRPGLPYSDGKSMEESLNRHKRRKPN